MRNPFTKLATVIVIASVLPMIALTSHAGDDDEIPFAEAKVFFQLNDTDGDLGFHAAIDGEPWKNLRIESPSERSLLDLRLRSTLRRQGLTELRFESAEPTFDELDPAVFFRRFPEGTYEIEGLTLDGFELESEVEISHVLPAPPENLQVSGFAVPEDCDEEPIPMIAGPLVLTWDPVVDSHPEIGGFGAIEITRYEVSVEREEPRLVVTADLPGDATDFVVPFDLLEPGDEIKFQILATDAGGNETSSESCFVVE